MQSLIAISLLSFFTACYGFEREDDRCEPTMRKIVSEGKTIVTDNTPSRLHSTWLSQECEVRAGPKYVIRRYSFFENGTFLLLQFHYAEESCSIATYTVVARGFIEISSPSLTISGATEANVQLHSVHLIPLNRQVAHKFGRTMNSSCGGIWTKWRPYLAQLIYERSVDFSSNASFYAHELNSNSLQSRLLRPRKRYTLDCLLSFGIEFTELRLLRIEIKRSDSPTNSSRDNAIGMEKMHGRVELLLGGLARNVRSRKTEPSPNRLQSTALLRVDTAVGCPICGSVFRATEYSPPLFHQAPSLPAVIDGLWLSVRCESVDGGFWSRRFFRIYSDDNRWSARWTYYDDSACSNTLYTVTAAGSYVQRAVRRKRDETSSLWRIQSDTRNVERPNRKTFVDDVRLGRIQNSLESNVYRHILQGTDESAVFRANRRQKSTDRITFPLPRKSDTLPSGTTELELRVIEGLSIPVSKTMSTIRCETATRRTREIRRRRGTTEHWKSSVLTSWSKDCIPRIVEAPGILLFKAKIGLDWNGDYILLLASWKDDLWDAPLRRCSGTASRNYFRTKNNLHGPLHDHLFLSQAHTRYERFNRHGRYWFPLSLASALSTNSSLLVHSMLVFPLCWFLVVY